MISTAALDLIPIKFRVRPARVALTDDALRILLMALLPSGSQAVNGAIFLMLKL